MEKILVEINEKLNILMSYIYVELDDKKIRSIMDIYNDLKSQTKIKEIIVEDINLIHKLREYAFKHHNSYRFSEDNQFVIIDYEDGNTYKIKRIKFESL